MKRYYERSLESKQKIASKFGISNRTLAVWVMDGEWENKVILKEIRAMYETHGMSINALSKKYGVSVNLKPPKQKSQISLVFGMNALVPLGTI